MEQRSLCYQIKSEVNLGFIWLYSCYNPSLRHRLPSVMLEICACSCHTSGVHIPCLHSHEHVYSAQNETRLTEKFTAQHDVICVQRLWWACNGPVPSSSAAVQLSFPAYKVTVISVKRLVVQCSCYSMIAAITWVITHLSLLLQLYAFWFILVLSVTRRPMARK